MERIRIRLCQLFQNSKKVDKKTKPVHKRPNQWREKRLGPGKGGSPCSQGRLLPQHQDQCGTQDRHREQGQVSGVNQPVKTGT